MCGKKIYIHSSIYIYIDLEMKSGCSRTWKSFSKREEEISPGRVSFDGKRERGKVPSIDRPSRGEVSLRSRAEVARDTWDLTSGICPAGQVHDTPTRTRKAIRKRGKSKETNESYREWINRQSSPGTVFFFTRAPRTFAYDAFRVTLGYNCS